MICLAPFRVAQTFYKTGEKITTSWGFEKCSCPGKLMQVSKLGVVTPVHLSAERPCYHYRRFSHINDNDGCSSRKGQYSETPWPQGAGVLPSFQLSLPCDRASSETKRTLSRPTLTVQDMTVGSAKSLPFRRLILLVATYARLQALLLSSQRREERFSCPGVHRLTVLWSLVRTSILLLSIAPNEASKERNAFHPLHKCQGLSSDLRCKSHLMMRRGSRWFSSGSSRGSWITSGFLCGFFRAV